MKQRNLQHLYLRAGFGEPHNIIQQNKNTPRKTIIANLFTTSQNIKFIKVDGVKQRQREKGNNKMMRQANRSLIKEINLKWFWQMVNSKAALQEKMSLFWHDHFASKHRNPYLTQRQINILHTHALGNFKELLTAISKDAVMIAYLNNKQNKKGEPNENFARELLELFTLGIGNYTETDIAEAARAFTGWTFDKEGNFRFNERQHDFGSKTFLGKTGNWKGEDIINIVLQKKQTARYITTKLYQYFVNPKINKTRIEALTDTFYRSDYNIETLMRTIFSADWFYEEENIGVLIKSPIEYLVSLCRTLRLQFEDDEILILMQKALGQVLLDPPNVAGWTSNQGWIDSSTLMFRLRMAAFLFSATAIDFEGKDRGDVNAIFRQAKKFEKAGVSLNWKALQQDFQGLEGNALAKALANHLLQVPINPEVVCPNPLPKNRKELLQTLISNILSLPEYQLI